MGNKLYATNQDEILKQDELRLMIKIARLHYHEGWLQRRISNELGLSTAKVSTLLSKAVEKGLVEIKINDLFSPISELEEEIKNKYGLNFVNVVPGPFPDSVALKAKLGLHAAFYLQKVLRKGHVIGITGGSTVNAMVSSDAFNTYIPVEVVPIQGGVSQADYHCTGNGHSAVLANRLGGTYMQVPFPVYVSSAKTCAAVMEDRSASEPLNKARNADVIVLGIGTVSTKLLTLPHISREEEMSKLASKGVVAEFGGHFLDENGSPVETYFTNRLIGIELEAIKQVPKVMAIAGGIEKASAIRAALLSGAVNNLIIDEATGRKLI